MVSGRMRRWTGIGCMVIGLTVAGSHAAIADEPFLAGLVPGVPLAEDELSAYDGKGVAASGAIEAVTRDDPTETGRVVPLHEAAEIRAQQSIDRIREVEDRLKDGVVGAAGAAGQGARMSLRENGNSDRWDALMDRAFQAEERTHWTVWY